MRNYSAAPTPQELRQRNKKKAEVEPKQRKRSERRFVPNSGSKTDESDNLPIISAKRANESQQHQRGRHRNGGTRDPNGQQGDDLNEKRGGEEQSAKMGKPPLDTGSDNDTILASSEIGTRG